MRKLTWTFRGHCADLRWTALERPMDSTRPGRAALYQWVSPHGPWDDLLNFIFDGGALSSSVIKGLRLVDSELRAFEFCDEGQAKERLRPYVWRRASAALEALET